MTIDRPRIRVALLCGLLLLMAPFAVVGLRYATGNVHEVEAGVLYRAGQLDAPALRQLVADKGIRTILNLRGAHPEAEWYRQEMAVARESGIDHRSLAISARSVPEMATMIEIARILREAPRPILVHCRGGSDRSGLVAAIHELVVDRADETQAAGQLSIAYGHFPWLGSRTIAMDRAFSRFAAYWKEERRELVAFEE